MEGLKIVGIEKLLEGVSGLGVAAVPPEKLSVMVGDTVRVHLSVDYRGPAIDGKIHITYGKKDTWFNEDGNKQTDIPAHFNASMDWTTHRFDADIYIGGSYGTGYDLYAKIISVPGPDIFTPTYLNVLDVLGAAEFRDFAITGYEKL